MISTTGIFPLMVAGVVKVPEIVPLSVFNDTGDSVNDESDWLCAVLAGSACARLFIAKKIFSIKKQVFFILSGINTVVIIIAKISKITAILISYL